MRIVIDVDGDHVTVISPTASVHGGGVAMPEDTPPGQAPAELLARAKKLGAMSAGGANIGSGAVLMAAGPTEAQKLPEAFKGQSLNKPGRRGKRKRK